MEWEYKVDEERFRELLKKYPRQLAGAMRRALQRTIFRFREVFLQAKLHGRPGLNRRTGDLIRSFVAKVSAPSLNLDALEAWSASRSPYAGIQETGGTVRPKNRKYLAVPLPGALTKAGAIRGTLVGSPLEGESRPSLYNVPGLFLIHSQAGNLLLAKKKGKGILPLFVLKKSVNIPPRMGFFETFRRWIAKPRFQRYFRNAVNAAWEKTRGNK